MSAEDPTAGGSGVGAPDISGAVARKSSGLVRQVGAGDTLLYNFIQCVLGFLIFTVVFWPLYPGASMELATVIVIAFCIAIGVTYALLSSAFPRSGGDYVILSRIFSPIPVVGFVISFLTTFLLAFYFGVNPALATIYGIQPLFSMLGLQTGSGALNDFAEFCTKDYGIFIVGMTQIVIYTALLLRGARTFFAFLRWAAIAAVVSVLVTIFVFILVEAGALDFVKHYNELVGPDAYAAALAAGEEGGTNLDPSFSLTQTLYFGAWVAFAIMFGQWSVSFAGEIKQVRRSQLLAMSGGMVLAGILLLGLVYFGKAAVGGEFLRAAPSVTETPLAGPFLSLFAAVAANSEIVTVFVNFWVIATIGVAGGACAIYTSRLILAWSIDGLMPTGLAAVSERYHSPTRAVLLSAVLATISLGLYSFTDWVTILSGLLGFATILGVTALAGAVFPFVQKERFEASPAAYRIGGIPVITITGLAAFVFEAYLFWRALADANLGAATKFNVILQISVVSFAVVWFYGAKWLRQREGTDLDTRFQEIPVE